MREPPFKAISRVNLLHQWWAGSDACATGQGPDACPHVPDTREGRFQAYYWLAGWWATARPHQEAWRFHAVEGLESRAWDRV